jgi:dipeptidyl aminopeptidase/acylaminoacyl peptidase
VYVNFYIIRQVAKSVPPIDQDNMVVFGFGYGGYVATMALSRPDSPFMCGAAAAPVATFTLHSKWAGQAKYKDLVFL